MLYVDKRNLELNLQVALLGIRNKELHFYTENLIAIGTQAALLSGFAYGGIIMSIFKEDANKYLKGAFLCTAIAAMSLELMTVGGSMIAAIYGPGLALRGPDGSMHRAVDGLLVEYKLAFLIFSLGLFFFITSSFLFVCLQFHWFISLLVGGGILYFAYDLWVYWLFLYRRFGLKEIVTGRFDFDASAAPADEDPAAAERKRVQDSERRKAEEQRQQQQQAAQRQRQGAVSFSSSLPSSSADPPPQGTGRSKRMY